MDLVGFIQAPHKKTIISRLVGSDHTYKHNVFLEINYKETESVFGTIYNGVFYVYTFLLEFESSVKPNS